MSEKPLNKELYTEGDSLKRGMKSRHLAMIAIGGTIGSGLFMGAGQIIAQAGPLGALLAFIFGGFVMLLALVSLAEMAVAMPISGSFQAYATRFISPMMGYITGWLYWLNWGTAAAGALTASSIIMVHWFPTTAEWFWCAIFLFFLALLNLLSANAFGETEFWFAGIKVAAIIIFIIVGIILILGFGNKPVIGLSAFVQDGLFPTSFQAVFFTMVLVVCSFQGAELVGIAAGESENPEKNVPQAVKAVGYRILLFYVLAVAVIACILPWQKAGVEESPFAAVFSFAGIPYASEVMNFVIVTSCLSAINSALYACSRLLWSMSRENLAPKFLSKTNKGGVPFYGVLATIALTSMAFLVKVVAASTVFLWIMSASGLIGCLIWIIIAWCQINFRKEYDRLGYKVSDLKFKSPYFPLIAWLGIFINAGVIISMYFDPNQSIVFYSGIVCVMLIVLAYYLFKNKQVKEKGDLL